jgi:hypothetical protein
MHDRVVICPQCGNTDEAYIFPQFTSLDDPGCRAGILCHHCGLFRLALFSWELSHRLLRRNLKFCRSRHSIFGCSDWKPVSDIDSLGSFQRESLKLQVTEMWPRMFPLLLNQGFQEIDEPSDIQVFKYLMHQTSGDLGVPAYTVRDFLSLAWNTGSGDCFGQPLAS